MGTKLKEVKRIIYRFLTRIITKISRLSGKPIIPFLVVITGQKCSLRCKDCCNFSPYLPQSEYQLKEICSDIDKLSSHLRIHKIQIQGGEALLYSELESLLDYLREKTCNIVIATNGTKLLSEKQIAAIKKAGATVRVSNYALPQQKANALFMQCKSNKIPSFLYSFVEEEDTWIDFGGEKTQPCSLKEASERFKTCPFSICLTLEDGILAHCSRATVSYKIQKFPLMPNDFVDVRNLQGKELKQTVINCD